MKPFKNKRSMFWLAGVFVVVVGFIVAALVLPARAPVPGAEGPSVNVPRMQNVPPENAPKLGLETE